MGWGHWNWMNGMKSFELVPSVVGFSGIRLVELVPNVVRFSGMGSMVGP
jgi:hypothetical protein